MNVTTSIIIPTAGKRATLGDLLDLLKKLPREKFETLVVSDGCELPAVLRDRFPDVRFLSIEVSGGPAVARNKALEHARGDVCVFVDDDVMPSPGAVERLADEVRQRKAVLVGRLLPSKELPDNAYLRSAYADLAHPGEVPAGCASWALFCASFAAAPRELLDRAGRFDESLRIYEDGELGFRLATNGAEIAVLEDVVAYHSKVMNRRWFVNRAESLGEHLYRMHSVQPAAKASSHVVMGKLRFLWPLGWLAWKILRLLLPLMERLPWSISRPCLRLAFRSGVAAGYMRAVARG